MRLTKADPTIHSDFYFALYVTVPVLALAFVTYFDSLSKSWETDKEVAAWRLHVFLFGYITGVVTFAGLLWAVVRVTPDEVDLWRVLSHLMAAVVAVLLLMSGFSIIPRWLSSHKDAPRRNAADSVVLAVLVILFLVILVYLSCAVFSHFAGAGASSGETPSATPTST